MNTKLLTGVAVCALTLAAGAASAAVITINSTLPSWGSAVGGTNVNTVTTGNNNNNTVYQVRWGTNIGDGQSGLGFNPTNPPSGNVNTGTTFLLGDLTHYNNAIASGSATSSVVLSLLTNIASATPTNQTFAYRFDVDETPNATPCAYPSSTPCADRITVTNLDTSNAFTVGGTPYTIEVLGFSSNGGATILSNFISQEGSNNTIGLYARITAPTPVPEPMSLALFGSGLLGLGLVRRRRGKA